MDKIKANAILEFNENQLQDVRKALGYEDVNRLKQDIEQLKDWIQKQNHFVIKEFDVEYLERWLIVNKGSIERTKKRFDRLCTFTNLMPEFLRNFDIKNEFHATRTVVNNLILSKPTKDHYRVLIMYTTGVDDKKFELIYFYRFLIVIIHYIMSNDYCFGFEFIGDLRNITIDVITKLNPLIIHKALDLIVESLAQRVKKIHLISGSKLFDKTVLILKQAMSAKLGDRIVVHPNVESLYKHFPKEQLPKELGGSEKSMKEMSDTLYKELSSDEHIARIKFLEGIGTDESRRLACKFNEEYSGMPGSFKTLCVD